MASGVKMKILVTGAAGFIGFHTVHFLLRAGHQVVGLDNINDYYDVKLKHDRLAQLGVSSRDLAEGERAYSTEYEFSFYRDSVQNAQRMLDIFATEKFDQVIHLAAQANVRYSITHPHAYIESNISGFLCILEACRHNPVQHLIYASSSSVYGDSERESFHEEDRVDNPVSLYAASKKTNELMAHTYSHLYGIPTSGLRFFTVYGPWGRPDMAPMLFAHNIMADKEIKVYNRGNLERDFTYVDDIVQGACSLLDFPPLGKGGKAPYALYNIGRGQPTRLLDFIATLEKHLGKKSIKKLQDMQPGDVHSTCADTSALKRRTGYSPSVSLDEGIKEFASWFVEYYKKQ
jgi:UDP-glucuronate 4-epimerase